MIQGAPIWLLWRDRASGGLRDALGPITEHGWAHGSYEGSVDAYITSAAVDVVIMRIFPGNGDSYFNNWSDEPYNSKTIDGILGFAGAAYAGNPNARIFLYASHTMDVGSYDDALDDPVTSYPSMKDTIESVYPDNNPVWIIPAPLAFNMMLDEGSGDLWVGGGDGHANDNGRYLLSMLFYSVVYKSDCAGAHSTGAAVSGNLPIVSADFAAKAQEVAWAAAQAYELSGVGSQVHIVPSVRAANAVVRCSHAIGVHDLLGRARGSTRRFAAPGVVIRSATPAVLLR
ncbi:MAG: hypothetical protein GF331_09500 [Chitinivibrionales bacterium]|nr:hypothetical protein [Chitinivibrionales bacterium]